MYEENQVTISTDWNEQDESVIRNGIRNFNAEMTKSSLSEVANIVLKDQGSNVIGGLLCKSYLKGFFVELLWIDENYRKHGFGSKLLKRAEEIAKEKGCNFIHLDTFSFQALEFYKKNGFEVFGTLKDTKWY